MGRAYEAPPLIEAICEFRFDSKEDWDFAIPGLLYERLKKTFPRREPLVSVMTMLAAGIGLVQPYAIPLIKFSQDDGNIILQVGQNLLTVNHLSPYSTWETFQLPIKESLHAYSEVANPRRFRQVALHYINRVTFQDKIQLEDYFNVRPFVVQALPQEFQSFIVGVELPDEDSAGTIKLELGSTDVEDTSSTALVLKITYVLSQPEEIELSQVLDRIRKAHEKLGKVFEACITDKLRQKFWEVK